MRSLSLISLSGCNILLADMNVEKAMTDSLNLNGGCLCGEIQYRTIGPPLWVCHCHCRMCQKHTGAAFSTFVGFMPEHISWAKRKPRLYQSSTLVWRGFCPECGSTISFHRTHKSEVSISAGSLDNPESVTPDFHIMTESQIPWLKLNDGLPAHHRFAPGGEDRDLDL